jgi:rod shape-determining protein MreC
MLNRPHYIALGLIVLMMLIMLNLPDKLTARMKVGIGSLFLPPFGLVNSALQSAGEIGGAAVSRNELLRQNEQLRRENDQLRLQLVQAGQTARENERLHKFVGWAPSKPWKFKLARVVLREPANWWRTVQINLGSRDGVRVNMPVLTPDGLVGRISSVVGLERSQVVLLGDANCRVSALVQNQARDHGVIGPSGPLDSALVELGYLPPNANLKAGQSVVTSGIGGIYPKEIPIGKIVDVHPADYGLSSSARVKLGANLNALEEVWVLFGTEP